MKKNNIFYACAAAALVFASCQKEAPAPEMPQADGMNVITATTLSTKTTTQDGVNVLWENGDQIGLFVGAGDRTESAIYTAHLDSPNSTATFERTEDPAPGSYNNECFALYPASSLNKWASSMEKPATRRVYVDLPTEQNANAGKWDERCGILAASSTNATFQFNHIMSYVKFTVDESSTPFVSLTVASLNKEPLTGTNIAVLYADKIAYDSSYTGSKYSSTAKISYEDGSEFLSGTYYLAVLPGTLAKGLSFTFESSEGQIVVKEVVQQVELKAGDVADMGTVGSLTFDGAAEPLELSTIYAENGVNQGIVFWIDSSNPTKGMVISLTAKTTNWAYQDELVGANSDSSLENHEYVTGLADYSADKYPAVAFCDKMRTELGGNWRLPSVQELAYFASTYYGSQVNTADTKNFTKDTAAKACTEAFDAVVTSAGGEAFTGVTTGFQYWTGKEKADKGKVCAPRFGSYAPAMSLVHTANTGIARCVRDVEMK